MSFTIALSGKGGVGKTSIASLVVKHLLSRKEGPVFAVDADPNSNLAEQLGVREYGTVGGIREDAMAGIFSGMAAFGRHIGVASS